jgi:hypothetical protein
MSTHLKYSVYVVDLTKKRSLQAVYQWISAVTSGHQIDLRSPSQSDFAGKDPNDFEC